ncbi:RNA helicase [Streptococcus agalactiae]|uniref:CRISPR-associated helicase/endonuclease Cas3 n=1 Tax=Streptococcus agalactiae TaxID=1311 RepID=UPI000657F388|nr:CRISPR-associated helicase/endonuclease Cas3 [Streptococcus agalactiae]KLK49329.1 RNA helicase [Streptococcus agalactiae]
MMTKETLAHYQKKIEQESEKKQSLDEHLWHVACFSRQEASIIGQGDVLFLISLYHDLGKADRAFQDKLLNNPNRHVDHSYAGAKYLCSIIGPHLKSRGVDKDERMTFNEMVGYVISAHHGMYDFCYCSDDAEYYSFNKFKNRINRDLDDYHYHEDIKGYAIKLEEKLCDYGYKDLRELIDKAFDNYQQAMSSLNWQDNSEWDYYQSCMVRLYLSLLKNADILDTVNAYGLEISPMDKTERSSLKHSYLAAIEQKYASFGRPNNQLNTIRTEIAERVKERGKRDSKGIYRLDLPTGAGKTNLSMRYAFHQLVHQDKSRFFYITPFLSVLEQNASEIRKVTGDLGVLEHHSNMVKQANEDDDKDSLLSAYLIDSWDSQVVLTSMVQFFQTLFKTKSANLRRFSSLINSVVILDEVQSLPIEVTTLFNLTMNFLNKVMDTTIVLCTATQPAYDSSEIDHRICYGGNLGELAEIVELTIEEKQIFSRTELRKFDDSDQKVYLTDVINLILGEENSVLAIFNTKKTVHNCYTMLKDMTDRPIYQLSTNMCAQHRLDLVAKIKTELQNNTPIICISTQLIEAGVDVDFHRVIRSYSGIDSIVQAAGRCNREGKRDKGQVTLVNLTNEEENISRLTEIKAKKEATESILYKIGSPINISTLNRDFFEYYYANNQGLMDYPLEDNISIYDYLSLNTYQTANKKFKGKLKQAFKTAGAKMNLINNDMIGILVPYGDAEKKLAYLEELGTSHFLSAEDYQTIKSLLKELQPFTVNVRENDPLLEATKSYLNGQILVLTSEYYDTGRGVKYDSASFYF